MKINANTILNDNNQLLREKAQDVSLPLSKEDKETLLAMIEYVRNSTDEEIAEKENLKPAVGIAAPQLGILKKLLAISFMDYDKNDNEILVEHVLANAKIISHSKIHSYLKTGEGCLSVEKAHQGYVKRYYKVKVKGFDLLKNKEVIITAKDYEAIVLQHEIDHFNGVLFYDRINNENPFEEIKDAIIIE